MIIREGEQFGGLRVDISSRNIPKPKCSTNGVNQTVIRIPGQGLPKHTTPTKDDNKCLSSQRHDILPLSVTVALICSINCYRLLTKNVAIRELANRGQGFLDETSIMEYGINGIPDSPSNKLILYGCTTIQEFKEKLVDTGSQVTLMKESVWNQLGSPSLINSGNILTGFGLSKTHVLGSFNSTVSIDNQEFPVKINVVPNHSMNFYIINGCNLIKQANLTITPDSVMFSKPQIEVSDTSPQPFIFAITDDIPKFDIGPEIPKQTRNDVEALLVCYRPNKIKTTDIELSITVTDDKPIYHSPRRLPFTERDIVDKQIDEWTQNGVIKPCSSAYASQVVVVHKKHGSPRVCIDFRKLNRVLVKDHYPLPLIEDILDKLQDTRVFQYH
ncbi:peptidase A2 domain-containing protein [Trichonephila clavipes]|nr:peptidase A2 domain-containing protein [Trichonephila clavipes]